MPFGSPAQRDPHQPFGQQSLPRTSAEQFAPPPPSRRPLWLSLGVLALVAMLIALAFRMGSSAGDDDPLAMSTPSATVEVSPDPGQTVGSRETPATGARSSIPFTNAGDGSAGTFRILRHRWTPQGLVLTVQVSLDRGSQRLGFFALDNGPTARQFNPSRHGDDDLEGRSITAGETVTGTVFFAKQPGDTTVFLSGSSGRQVAALTVEG